MELPEFKPAKKPNPVARIGIAIGVVAPLVVGGIWLSGMGTSPNERATRIAKIVAQDALIAVFDKDETKQNAAGTRIRADIDRQLEGTGCTWVGGSMAFGDTPAEAAEEADKQIAAALDRTGDKADEYGTGYVIVRGSDAFVAVLAAIHCPPAPAAPGLGS